MMRLSPNSDVVVVGAGILGLMTAVRLRAAGHNVVIIEAETKIGHSQSGKWAGVIHLPGRRYINGGTGMYEAQEFFVKTFPNAQLSSTGWEFGSADQIRQRLDNYLAEVPPAFRDTFGVVDPGVIADLYPELQGMAAATVPKPVFDPLEILRDLTARALTAGVEFRLNAPVVAIDPEKHPSVKLENGERITADLVILSAGPGHNRLLGEHGLRAIEVERLRVRIMTIVVIEWEGTRDNNGERITVNGFHSDGSLAFGVVPATGSWSRSGAPNESVGGLPVVAAGNNTWGLPQTHIDRTEESLEKLAELFPASQDARRVTYKAMRTDQPEHLDDANPQPNAYIYHHGKDHRVVSANPGKAGQAGLFSTRLFEEVTGQNPGSDLPLFEMSALDLERAAAMTATSFMDFAAE